MGSASSKQPETTPKTQVWTSETPVRFSQGLVDSLQSSPESDSTRAKALELHIQSRVSEELKKLQDRAARDFEELSAKLSTAEDAASTTKQQSATTAANLSEGDQLRQLGREAVQNDVAELKRKLEGRKKLADVGEGVEKAKSEVVRCLRENDRRPLDCWKEVEGFRREVKRLEDTWVEKIVR